MMGMETGGESQSVEQAMQYLQEVEKELPEADFAEFLNIIEDFKSNRSSLSSAIFCLFSPPCWFG
jgi:hypothetical protein